jgi:hypothetical protein
MVVSSFAIKIYLICVGKDNQRVAEKRGPNGILNPRGPSHCVFLENQSHNYSKSLGEIVRLI